MVGDFSEGSAWGIVCALEQESAFHIIHLTSKLNSVPPFSLPLDCAVQLVEALLSCKLPVITVLTHTECSGDKLVLIALADIVVLSCSSYIQMSPLAQTVNGDLAEL